MSLVSGSTNSFVRLSDTLLAPLQWSGRVIKSETWKPLESAKRVQEVANRVAKLAAALLVLMPALIAAVPGAFLKAGIMVYHSSLQHKGKTLFEQKKFDLALAAFNRAMTIEPHNPYSMAGRGESQLQLKHYAEAIADFDAILKVSPATHVLLSRAHANRELKNYALAIADYQEVLKAAPSIVTANEGLIAVLMQRAGEAKSDDEAYADYQAILKIDPASIGAAAQSTRKEAAYQSALITARKSVAYSEEHKEELLAVNLELLRDHPDSSELKEMCVSTLMELGDKCLKKEDFKGALAHFKEALKIEPENIELLKRAAKIHQHNEHWALAINAYNDILSVTPDDLEIVGERGMAYLNANCCDSALNDLYRIGGVRLAAALRAKAGAVELSDALDLFNAAIDLDPSNPDGLRGRGVVYGELKNYHLAWADLTVLLRKEPSCSNYLLRALISFKQKNFDAALLDVQEALKLEPENCDALWGRGKISLQKGNWEEALSDFQTVLSLDPDHSFALFDRGTIYKQQKKFSEALADFKHSLENLDYDEQELAASCCLHSGEILREQNRLDDALEAFENVLRYDEDSIVALRMMGDIYRRQNRFAEALGCLNRALEKYPRDLFALSRRGSVYLQQNELELALYSIELALSVDPRDPFSLARRGNILRKQEKWEEALSDLNLVLELESNNDYALARRASVYFNQGKEDLAMADLNAALVLNGKNLFALRLRGLLHKTQGRYTEALADCATVLGICERDDYMLKLKEECLCYL